MEFEWDPAAADTDHSANEHRYITVRLSNREKPMNKRRDKMSDELRPEYDLRQILKGAIRGKYAKRYHAGTNLVLLDPDVRKSFRSEKAVNDALRLVIELRKVGSGRAGTEA